MTKTKTAAYKAKTKTIITRLRPRPKPPKVNLADLTWQITFKLVNATLDLHSSDFLSTE